MVINPSVPAKNVKELIATASRSRCATARPASATGSISPARFSARRAGVEMLHVPYKGGGPAMTAVLGGEVEVHYPAASVGLPHVKAGKVRAIGFTGAKRLELAPRGADDRRSGAHRLRVRRRLARGVRAGENAVPLVNRMHAAIRKALDVPQVRDHFLNGGYEPQGAPPAEWAKIFREDLKRYAEICRIAKIEKE